MGKALRKVFQGIVILVAGTAAMAHDNATLDTMTAPHHGQLRMAGPYHFELVLGRAPGGKSRVSVYVTDHMGVPSVIQGGYATAHCTAGETVTTVLLQQRAPDRFEGVGVVPRSPTLACVVSLEYPDGTLWAAQFTPRAPRAQGASQQAIPQGTPRN